MENYYLFLIIALAALAIADLVVGVSNDAVNFLNSALGSKAVSFRTVMIVASIGIACGAIFSSGLMEVARKGIFVPSEFMFSEIMIIFMAVMITDIILLDFFNSIGLPTSTTVSIVFELLGAAVCVALIKMSTNDESFNNLFNYINTETATKIIIGIFASVFIAFLVGAVVQYVSRFVLSFEFENKATWVSGIFGGLALAAISYFILIKGLKGTDLISKENLAYIKDNPWPIIGANIVVWTIVSFILTALKTNIYKTIIVVGTFALALAFAGNDLVNFIGVPIASWQAFQEWMGSGVDPTTFSMEVLGKKVETPTHFLVVAGLIMVLTLWMSKKARKVVKTSIDLSRQDEGQERFKPNYLSRVLVRGVIQMNRGITAITPESLREKINTQFTKPVPKRKIATADLPAFDMVRAAVNLVVASVLISLATSMKLPLSTTYVTFMVAMGTSLADRAWGTESAVYRVAGVLNVIGGWFLTALIAFTTAAIFAFTIHKFDSYAIIALLILAVGLLVRSSIKHKKLNDIERTEDKLRRSESNTIQGVIEESTDNISSFSRRSAKLIHLTIDGLAKQDLATLKKCKKGVAKLDAELEELKDNIFYFIKNLEESSVGASNFYISILGYLQDMTQSIQYITKTSHKHVNNNHRNLRFNQIKDLKEVEEQLSSLLNKVNQTFANQKLDDLDSILDDKQDLLDHVRDKIQKQIERTRSEESSPKNTTLYFNLLTEIKDFIKATMNLLEMYKR
ncbi:MAG: inorganic phosphate transporter [Flavobacteriaceae bacterium]|nr:inorganic phosphate transporter [Flavobacteriaceae bacterium]